MTGRPSEYRPEYCDLVIELGKLGKSVVQMACAIDVSRQTLYEWAETHEDFSDAFTRAKQWAQDWWETQGQLGLTADKFNAPVWSRSMAARFPADYQERKGLELTGAEGGPVKTVTRIELVAAVGSDDRSTD